MEQELRALQRRIDSLAWQVTENDELSAAMRKRIGEDLDRAVWRMAALATRGEGPRRLPRQPPSLPFDPLPPQPALPPGPLPRGWMGLVIEGTGGLPRIENGELVLRYYTYPRVASVDPSSPAQRAGIATDDTLLAYDGRDVRDHDIWMTQLLRPNRVVRVRLKREGRVREVPVRVAPAPGRIALRRDGELEGRRPGRISWPEAEQLPLPAVPDPPSLPERAGTPPPPFALRSLPGRSTGVAGAELVSVTAGLGRTLGVSRGVLVTNAPVGSLAYDSGVRDGDVITAADGQAVQTVTALREIVRRASANGVRGVELALVRDRRPRRATLRW